MFPASMQDVVAPPTEAVYSHRYRKETALKDLGLLT